MIKVFQLNVGGFDHNFSYIIHDTDNYDTAIIDPCGDINIIISTLNNLKKVVPKYILLTHGHHDHISGISEVRKFFPAKIAAHPLIQLQIDTKLKNNETLPFGKTFIKAIYSPGHTEDSILYLTGDNKSLFTGDTLFIDCCGYCNPEIMFKTMREIIFNLPNSCEVYSGHDYGRSPHAQLGKEKVTNPYLSAINYQQFKKALNVL